MGEDGGKQSDQIGQKSEQFSISVAFFSKHDFNWWISKQNVVYLYTGMLFGYKKEQNLDTYYMDNPWKYAGNSLVVQWLGLHAFTAQGTGSIPGQELGSHKPHSAAKKKKKNASKRSQSQKTTY